MAPHSLLLSFLPLSALLSTQLQTCNAAPNFLTRPYSARMADSIILRGQGIHDSTSDSSGLLQVGAFQTALFDLIQSPSGQFLEQDWEAHLAQSADSVVGVVENATQDVQFPLDRLSVGKGLLHWYKETGNTSYKDSLNALHLSIDLQPRNAYGGLWYYTYPNWSYLDGMFSLLSFLPVYASAFSPDSSDTSTDFMFHQLDLLWTRCHDNSTALLVHGYDASKTAVWADATTGASPFVWIRALGWFMMALVDFLSLHVDRDLADLEAKVAIWHARFVSLCNALVTAADPVSGAWMQILNSHGRQGNYIESSGSAMVVYALLKGVRLGLLDDAEGKYTGVTARAYQTLVDEFVVENEDGSLSYAGTVGVCSLNSTASYEYYVHQPLVYDSVLGSAAFVRASVEHEWQN